MIKRKKSRKGFTVVELLVVVALVAILSAVATDIFIHVTRAYNKANVIAEIEQNGTLVLASMGNEIRDAATVSPAVVGNGIEITTREGDLIRFCFLPETATVNGYIARREGAGDCGVVAPASDTQITDYDFINGINVTNSVFTINNSAQPPVVRIEVSFSQPKGVPARIDFQAQTTLSTTITLRAESE
jgi:prepilin-type N-terminal cleavage/methylation domain-containing protein